MSRNLLQIFLVSLAVAVRSEENVRVITKEELAKHDGKQSPELWLSIMSKVYDVSRGSEYYGEKGPYKVFVGKDANVPFITGNFTDIEAEKSITTLTPKQMLNLETWTDFYDKEDKYPFVGVLEGELYDKDGQPTAVMAEVKQKIEEARIEREEQKKKRKELLEKRKREDAEKAKIKDAKPKNASGKVIPPLKSEKEL
jgi:hypothetical protein